MYYVEINGGNFPPSPQTVAYIKSVEPSIKESVGDITKIIVEMCQYALTTQPGDNPAIAKKDAVEILNHIDAMMKSTGERSKNLSVDRGLDLLGSYLKIADDMKRDIIKKKLNSYTCKRFIHTGHTIINYMHDVTARAS